MIEWNCDICLDKIYDGHPPFHVRYKGRRNAELLYIRRFRRLMLHHYGQHSSSFGLISDFLELLAITDAPRES